MLFAFCLKFNRPSSALRLVIDFTSDGNNRALTLAVPVEDGEHMKLTRCALQIRCAGEIEVFSAISQVACIFYNGNISDANGGMATVVYSGKPALQRVQYRKHLISMATPNAIGVRGGGV